MRDRVPKQKPLLKDPLLGLVNRLKAGEPI